MILIKSRLLVAFFFLYFSGVPPGGVMAEERSLEQPSKPIDSTLVATPIIMTTDRQSQSELKESETKFDDVIDGKPNYDYRAKSPLMTSPAEEPEKKYIHEMTSPTEIEQTITTPTLAPPTHNPLRKVVPPKPRVLNSSQEPSTTTEARPIIPDLPAPTLPEKYEVHLDVMDMFQKESFQVVEKEQESKARHILETKKINVTCIFNSITAEGYLVEGVKCTKYNELPQKCFCVKKFCRAYVPVGALLKFLRSNNATLTKQSLGSDSGVEFWSWRVSMTTMSIEAVYSTAKKGASSGPPSYDQLVPISFSVKGSGRVFLLPGGEIWLHYRVSGWSLETDSTNELVSTPPGVFCPVHERKFLPNLSNQFSLTMETIIENLQTIAYERQHYDADEKLVSFTYKPHLHAEGMFLLSIPGLTDISLDSYRVVHDFKTGIQYSINEKTSNCSIQGIPSSALDATPTDSQHIRLRHASELIFIDPTKFKYKGKRLVRGVTCDVWVAERGVTKGRYSTVEVYFSHENWTVEIEVFNKVRQVPIGVSTYVADADSPRRWTSIVHTFFYEYSDSHPSWDEFDISPCLNRINRVFLRLTLEVSYAELVHYNVELAKNSIRRAVAGIAGVSPLRVTDLFLSSRQATGEVDVWFVLLEKPDFTGPVLTPRPQLMMADAYKLLHDITHKHNVSVKLDLSPTKRLFVTIKRGSLETSSDALHPPLRHKSLRFLKAGYTAGSMAGLGFSMAILGTCVGVFVGFLLWKRSSSVPYQIAA